MARTYRALGALLSYPTKELQRASGDVIAALRAEGLLPQAELDGVAAFCRELAGRDIYDLQERYVALFDRGRSVSLHLFEHVHGESRDRGQAMVDLIALYRAGGYAPATSELPDFLPLFL